MILFLPKWISYAVSGDFVCLLFVLFGFFFLSFISTTLHTNVFPGYDQLEACISTNTCRSFRLSIAHMLLPVCRQKPCGSHVRITWHKCPFRRAFVLQPKLPASPKRRSFIFSSKTTCFQKQQQLWNLSYSVLIWIMLQSLHVSTPRNSQAFALCTYKHTVPYETKCCHSFVQPYNQNLLVSPLFYALSSKYA